ncbi:MAG: NFACT RNA binding domain-containing protein [Lentisphaeria bacterium]|nr:NFACT RNA binding domain-containing protein [Candidatus Neomarinimicrobiota bacterium]MCF7842406.1 NFACT RNA binding domain-containing protein [Lentisphaeria bacterium]
MLDNWITLWHWTTWLEKQLPGFVLQEIFTYQKQRMDLFFEKDGATIQLAWLTHKNQFTFYTPRTPSIPRRRVEIFKDHLRDPGTVKNILQHPAFPLVRIELENHQAIIFDFRHPKGNVYLCQNTGIQAQFLKAVPWRPVQEKWMNAASLKQAVLQRDISPHQSQKTPQPLEAADFDSMQSIIAYYNPLLDDSTNQSIADIVRQILHQGRQTSPENQAESVAKRGKTVLMRWKRKLKKQSAEIVAVDTETLQIQADGLAIAIASNITPLKSDEIRLPAHLSPSGSELSIPLNRALSLQENLAGLYQQVRKLKSRQLTHQQRMAKTQTEIEALETILKSADESALKHFLEQHGERFTRSNEAQSERIPYRKFTSPSGFSILVGRSARDNDILTFKRASKFDWWFHARGVTGSHVILQTGKQTPQQRDLVMAAQLAVRYSDAKHAGVAPVSYCQRKYLSKPKSGAPGAVKIFKEEVLTVEPYHDTRE